ncbi:MAG: diguanylate cyclase [Nitrospinae bacterium]|nr:diguanylate cyclase [Nitrospinota bacterium]
MSVMNNSRILVVEDSPQMLNLIRTILLRSGFEVVTAMNGKEGLDAVRMHDVDLIISDIMMPEMDGFQFCSEVRKNSRSDNIPFIFLSAKGGMQDKLSGFEGGADDYITKPFDPNELMMRVTAILKRTSRYRLEAYTDSLTGLSNRRYFDKKLAEVVSLSHRYKKNFGLAIFDIDFFKDFNDKFGHLVGDQVLIHLGRFLKDHLRDSDFSARYGGEEFVVILPDTSKETSMMLMNRMREAVQDKPLIHDGKEYRITVSVGVAEYPTDGDTARELIKCADDALYESKTSGRNCVTAYLKKQAANS